MNTPELNFFGYRVIDNSNGELAKNVTASFQYRGYEVAFTTFNPAGAKPVILRNHVFIAEHHTVEACIAAIDELLNWRGAGDATARAIALRHVPKGGKSYANG